MSKEEMIKKVTEMLSGSEWWLVNLVYRATVNVTKPEKGSVA